MSARSTTPALVLLVLAVGLTGCGGGSEESEAEAIARENAADRAAMAIRLERLRDELRSRKARRKAEREREARRADREQPQAAAGGGAAAGSFERLAAGLSGEVGAAIGPPGSGAADSFGGLQSGSAWSTIKVPIALRVLDDAGGPGGLSGTQAEQVRSALTLSDNEAAAALFAGLERRHGGLGGASAAVEGVLREGGDGSTVVSTQGRGEFSTYGQTEWSLANQQRFMSGLAAGCVVGPESSGYVLDLMGEVSSDAWGLGSSGLPARWKGGWGPGIDGRYLVRQMGVLETGGGEAVVALAAIADDGSFESAQSLATAVAQWLAELAPKYAAAPSGC